MVMLPTITLSSRGHWENNLLLRNLTETLEFIERLWQHPQQLATSAKSSEHSMLFPCWYRASLDSHHCLLTFLNSWIQLIELSKRCYAAALKVRPTGDTEEFAKGSARTYNFRVIATIGSAIASITG